MRVDLLFKKNFTFDLWDFIGEQDATGVVTRTYSFKESGKAMVIPMSGGATQLMTSEPLEVYQQVRNILDRNGNPVSTSHLWVHTVEAQVDPFGIVIGYKNTLRDRVPRELVDSVSVFRNA